MVVDLNDLISRKRIRFELGESTMPKKYRDFCLRVIDDEHLTPTVVLDTPQEGFRNERLQEGLLNVIDTYEVEEWIFKQINLINF